MWLATCVPLFARADTLFHLGTADGMMHLSIQMPSLQALLECVCRMGMSAASVFLFLFTTMPPTQCRRR